MGYMQPEQRIGEERSRIKALDSSLDPERTPYLKNQLRFAGHMLDDAVDALRFAAKADSNYGALWTDFAEMNIQNAIQRREKVQALVDRYGGPKKVMEVG